MLSVKQGTIFLVFDQRKISTFSCAWIVFVSKDYNDIVDLTNSYSQYLDTP